MTGLQPPVPAVIPADALRTGAGRTRRFVGREHGAGVSYFFVDNDPGEGPGLHRHPYTETWVVLEGEATISVGGVELHAVEGDTATVQPYTWHRFTNAGTGRLRMLCIHASHSIVQEWQDTPGRLDIPGAAG